MSKFERVLSDRELLDVYRRLDNPKRDRDSVIEAMRAAVDAAMRKLAEQETVAWRVHPFDYGVGVEGAYAITQQEDMRQAWINKGWEVTPLYAHPMPCASQSTDKTACVSGNGKSDRQLARHQPCGCVVCYCENQERCLGCGAKYCGTHEVGEIPNPVYVDHIPDAGKMITPLAQRKIQSLLDNGEYRVIENATVLVNERGHAAIVNHGGAFYWVENKALAREYDGRAMPAEASLPGPKKEGRLSLSVDTKETQRLLQSYLDGLKDWQLVPKEPTPEMVQASDDSDIEYSKRSFGDGFHFCQSGYDHYKAMLAAAPKCTGDSNE